MKDQVFPQMNTLVKMRESTLLSKQQKAELISAADEEAAFKMLSGTSFFTYASPKQLSELDLALATEKRSLIDWGYEVLPEIPVGDLFEIPDIVHNLKVFAKERIMNRDLSGLYVQSRRHNRAFFTETLSADAATLHPIDARINAAALEVIEDFETHGSFAHIDLLCTFFGHAELFKLCETIGDLSITDFIGASMDLELLSILLQARENGIVFDRDILAKEVTDCPRLDVERLFSAAPPEQEVLLHNSPYSALWDSLKDAFGQGFFDVYTDNYLLNLCKKAKLMAFGVFPLFAFSYARLLDIKTVRMIFTLKDAKVNRPEIEERLREEYGL